MNDDRLRQLYAEVVAARGASTREECVAPEAILELVERKGGEPERLATLDHVMACPHCTREFELLRSVERVGPSLAGERTTGGRRSIGRPLALAASVLLLVTATLVWRSTESQQPVFRGASDTVTVIAPSGDVTIAGPLRLVWNSVENAVRYDIEVLDEAGRPVFSATAADTSAVVPDSVSFGIGIAYRWWVQATLSDSRTVRSAMLPFVRR